MMGKYDGLRELLFQAGDLPVTLAFARIAQAVGGLPPSAFEHPSWWANNGDTHSHARAWLSLGRRVESLSLSTKQVTFSAPADAAPPTPVAAPRQAPVTAAADAAPVPVIPWDDVWSDVAEIVRGHVNAGRGHLLTEDVLRFATVLALEESGVPAAAVRFEHRIPEISASLDLVVGDDPDAVVELKYPRDPTGFGAADTMTFGELLRDFYRLAWLDLSDAWALQVMDQRLRGYLSRRGHVSWTWSVGESLRIRPEAMRDLPVTTARSLPVWTATMAVDAECTASHEVGGLVLAAYRVRPAELATGEASFVPT